MKKLISGVALAALCCVSLSGSNAFAVDPYGISYSGGNLLGANNVVIEPELLSLVTPLLKTDIVSTTPTEPERWNDGYIKDSGICHPIKYFTVHSGPVLQATPQNNNPRFTISNGKYRADVEILDEVLHNLANGTYAIGILPDTNFIYAGWQIYNDENCEVLDSAIVPLNYDDGRIFLELRSTLYKEGSTEPFVTNNMAFGITDIDAAQSYKILSEGNQLVPDNMFAISAESLQPASGDLRNMYVPGGNYIYSQYDPVTKEHIETANQSHIYTPLLPEVQSEGLHFVFGFAGNAASGIEYYALKHKVEYDTDENGEITGITDEEKFDGEHASGSSYKSKNSYRFSHWIADVDVVLEDGTVIKSGNPITSEQIKKVVVDRDIKFTAIFEIDVEVPNTGSSTMETNGVAITLSVFGVLLGALFIRSLPHLMHKKMGFDR